MLGRYQARLFTPWPAGKTLLPASTVMGTTAQDEGDALDCRRGIILWWRSGGLCSGRQQALTPASVQILIEFGKQLITPSP